MTDLTKQIEVLTKRVQEAELETSLIKAVGQNSPEMKALKKELNEVKEDNKQLSNQINEMISRLRDANF
jgi:septal ring factor EnvC (AmiA/AmiB activator)